MSASAASAPPAAELIAFAASAWAFRDAVRAPGRRLVLDTVARAVADARSERVEIAAAEAPAGTRLRARALGRRFVTTPLRAAFLSALAAGSGGGVHAPVVCAALALGESLDASGATVLDAAIAGTEIAVRVQRALGEGHARRGWDARGTCGRLGAAIAAGRLLGLQRDAMRNALGIAATASGGLLSAHGTMTADYVGAAAAGDGIEAALLARAEFTGAPLAIEGRRGLAALMTDTFDPSALAGGLGEDFAFARFVPPEPACSAPPEVSAAVARIERLASIRELIDAT